MRMKIKGKTKLRMAREAAALPPTTTATKAEKRMVASTMEKLSALKALNHRPFADMNIRE